MAKKTVASLHEGSKEGRAYTKVIKMVKSPKTGAYVLMNKWLQTKKYKTFSKNNQNSIKRYKHKIPSLANSEGIFYCFFFYFSNPLLYLCSIMYYTNNCRYGIF